MDEGVYVTVDNPIECIAGVTRTYAAATSWHSLILCTALQAQGHCEIHRITPSCDGRRPPLHNVGAVESYFASILAATAADLISLIIS